MNCAVCWEEDKLSCNRADHAEASRKREARRGWAWASLVIKDEYSGKTVPHEHTYKLGNGERQYLNGLPIHCGAALVLQHTSVLSDDFGEFPSHLDVGTEVRYEIEHKSVDVGTVRIPVMYVSVGGRGFKAVIDPYCHFKWPERER